jgi:polyhydroxybutyrate depolymerase
MGFSKGGMMAYRAACVLRGQITAIAAVSATLSSADCPNPQGVSVLHIHGTNDQNVPFNGGVGADTGGRANWPAVQRGLQYFTSGNQCFGQPQSKRISSDTSCSINSCGNNEQVQLCLVQGGGHAWPGAQPAKWQINLNVKVSQSFNATDYIARFLLVH